MRIFACLLFPFPFLSMLSSVFLSHTHGLLLCHPRTIRYCDMLYEGSTRGQKFYQACTPGWYNNDGSFQIGKTLNTSYKTAIAYGEMLETSRAEGRLFEGLELS